MKHNYTAWRHLDPAPTEAKGGAILEAIEKNHKATTEQIEAVKAANQKSLDDAKTELQDEISAAKGTSQKALEKVEEIEKKMATSGMGGNGGRKSFGDQVEEKLIAHKSDLPLSVGKKFSFDIEIDRKAVGNMASSTSLTGSYFVAPTVVPGMVLQPYNSVHVRNIIATGNTDSNLVRHVRDNGGEGGPTTVAEGGTKPQIDRDLSIVDAPVRKIATYFRVPEEMIEDIPFLTSFLTNVGTEEVLAVEDTQLLYGDGTGQNISGIANTGNFTAFAAGSTVIGASSNRFDVLGMSSTQMRLAKRNPSIHLVNPRDYFEMVSAKDTTNNYILRGGGNGILPVDAGGVPVVQMNQIAAGDFITIDRNAAQIFFRSNINVRFYEQDQDNAIKNMVTIVIEERLALAIYFTSGIIKGTFSAAITDLTS